MIEEKAEDFKRWSTEHKQWAKKLRLSLQKKDSSFQSYTTTLDLFQTIISACDQIAEDFDKSSKELEKILRTIPKPENRSVKSKLIQERSIVKKEKHNLDALEKELHQVQNNLERIQKKLDNSQLNTQKHKKFQEDYESLVANRKDLKKQIKRQRETCQQVEKQYRTNTEEIYKESQKKELARLKTMPDPFEKFIKALKIDPASLKQAIEKYNPETDLSSWEETYFSSSFKSTAV
jgi:chromosome segregation ATPase